MLNDANGAFNPRVEEEPSKPIEVKKVKVKGKKAKKKKKMCRGMRQAINLGVNPKDILKIPMSMINEESKEYYVITKHETLVIPF